MFDYIVVGAGYAGVVIAERIATQLDKKVLIIEKRNHIAGNCFDEKNNDNILLHRYGPHLFHTDKKEVFRYLSQYTQWSIYSHKVLAFVDGKEVSIPFNLNTLYDVFPNTLAQSLEKKLLDKFSYNSKIPILELKKSIDKDLKFLADYIYEKIFLHYTSKQWGMKPDDIDSAVTARVPILIGKDDRYFNDKYQAVPKHGYTKLFENMLNHRNIKIMLNTDFKEVCQITEKGFMLFGNEYNSKVIYTGAIDELFEYRFGDLTYRSIDMQFETLDQEYYQKSTTVNYPNNYNFTRITEFKHIHSIQSKKTTILKEYPIAYSKGVNIPYYPIFTESNQKKYTHYLEYSKQWKNLILLGRLAEYKYYDMDDIVERALEVFQQDIMNERS